MDLQRYDVIKAKIKYQGEGSVQTKERPYVIVSNPLSHTEMIHNIKFCSCEGRIWDSQRDII